MQVTETLNEGLKRGYAITVPATELEAKVTEKLEEARKDFQMKGFRKGKAPAALMKKMFGKSVLGEAMQETIDKAMRDHFEASGDRPALQPEVKMTNEDWKEGEDVEVSMTYEALPQVPEVAFGELKLEKLVAEIEDASVDEALQNLAASAKDFEDRKKGSKAKDGDQVVIDFKGSVDGELFDGGSAEDFPLVLGSKSFIPGFEDQLVGVKAGDELEVKVTFPEGYGAPNLAGKEASFAVTVKAVKAPKPAAIDDALATRYGAESLDALKEQVRKRLADEYAQASRAILKRRLMDALDERVAFEVPPTLVDVEAKQIAHQLWHEEHHDHHGHEHGEIEPTRRAREARRAAGAARAAARRDRQQARRHRARGRRAARGLRPGAAVPGAGAAVLRVHPEEPAGLPADPGAAVRGPRRRLHPRARPGQREAGRQGRAAEGDRGARRGRGDADRAGAGGRGRGVADRGRRLTSPAAGASLRGTSTPSDEAPPC